MGPRHNRIQSILILRNEINGLRVRRSVKAAPVTEIGSYPRRDRRAAGTAPRHFPARCARPARLAASKLSPCRPVSWQLTCSPVYRTLFSRDAIKALRRMPRNTAELIRAKIDGLARDPHAPNNNVRKLTGRPGWRLRVGDWRVIYDLDDALRVLAVERIAPRGGAYE